MPFRITDQSNLTIESGRPKSRVISAKTLITSRWIAIAGQAISVLLCDYIAHVQIPILPCLAVIAVSIIVNLVATFHKHQPISARLASGYLAYDIIQLSALLFLTGGLGNPFFVLMVAPVAVGASILPRNPLLGLIGLAMVCVVVLSIYAFPLISNGQMAIDDPIFRAGKIGALTLTFLFISAYIWRLSSENRAIQRAYQAADSVLSRQRQLTALGAQASAAAHELGSPLSTIAVIARELKNDLGNNSAYSEDIDLLITQCKRCSQILSEFGRAPKTDPYIDNAPVRETLKMIAETFQEEHPHVSVSIEDLRDETTQRSQPLAQDPEIIHGLGVFVQNALEFAKNNVNITIEGIATALTIRIEDDGNGFSASVLSQLGQPYVSSRLDNGKNRGLGIFIAQTMLEDTGAELTYGKAANGGAMVTIRWKEHLKRKY